MVSHMYSVPLLQDPQVAACTAMALRNRRQGPQLACMVSSKQRQQEAECMELDQMALQLAVVQAACTADLLMLGEVWEDLAGACMVVQLLVSCFSGYCSDQSSGNLASRHR